MTFKHFSHLRFTRVVFFFCFSLFFLSMYSSTCTIKQSYVSSKVILIYVVLCDMYNLYMLKIKIFVRYLLILHAVSCSPFCFIKIVFRNTLRLKLSNPYEGINDLTDFKIEIILVKMICFHINTTVTL